MHELFLSLTYDISFSKHIIALLAVMDSMSEWEKELGDSAWKWRSQKKRLEKEKAVLVDALRVKKDHVQQLEALLEDCVNKIDLCDGRIEIAELIDDLVPHGSIELKKRALIGWKRIRATICDEQIGHQEKAEKCLRIYGSHIENQESANTAGSNENVSSTSGKRSEVYITNSFHVNPC